MIFPPLSHSATPLENYQSGIALYQAKDYQKALDFFDEVIQTEPSYWRAYQLKGYCLYYLGQKKAALEAVGQSLKMNPDNPSLNKFFEKLGSTPDAAVSLVGTSQPATPGQPVATPTSPATESGAPKTEEPPQGKARPASLFAQSFWVKLSSGLNFATLGDLNSGSDAWNRSNQYGGGGNSQIQQLGLNLGVEAAFMGEPNNALAVGFEYLGDQQYKASVPGPDGSTTAFQLIHPTAYSASFNYYFYFSGGDSRLYLVAGVGYYYCWTNYYENNPTQTISGTLSGGNIGGTLGIGNVWNVSKSIGIEVSARFRYATIPRLQGDLIDLGNGKTVPAALAVSEGTGLLSVQSNQTIDQGSGFEYASMDYIGFDLKASMDFYLF